MSEHTKVREPHVPSGGGAECYRCHRSGRTQTQTGGPLGLLAESVLFKPGGTEDRSPVTILLFPVALRSLLLHL